jgi:hypothetical protein
MKYFITCYLIVAMAIPQTKAQLGILNDLLGSANIQGTVLCTSKDNVGVNGAVTPGFSSKATIHLTFIFATSIYVMNSTKFLFNKK